MLAKLYLSKICQDEKLNKPFYIINLTFAIFNIRFEALIEFVLAYLSDIYTTSVMPLCIMTFAHSLQGNNATYIWCPNFKKKKRKKKD